MFEPDPDRGYRLKPGFQGKHIHRDFEITYSINSLGFRDINFPVKKEPGVYRILVLGDSMIFGIGVPLDQSIPQTTRTDIEPNQPRDDNIELLMRNLTGYSLDRSNMLMKIPALKPIWYPVAGLVQYLFELFGNRLIQRNTDSEDHGISQD